MCAQYCLHEPRLIPSQWPSRRCEGDPVIFSSWALPFCLRMYSPPDAEHRVLVLQRPGVQHGQTVVGVDYVRCHLASE